MSRIEIALRAARSSGRVGLVPFLMAGDPDLGETAGLVDALAEGGADVIELGIPFSDPVADGPVIQRSSERALAGGTNLARALKSVEAVRALTNVPLLLFGYLNPILAFGPERLAREAVRLGVDGLLIVDLPIEEGDDLRTLFRGSGLDTVQLVAPTSGPERIVRLTAESRGFVYCISRTGVTGAQSAVWSGVEAMVARVREATSLPVAVGFGISRYEHIQAVAKFADAAVVGSALVEAIAARAGTADDRRATARKFLRHLRGEEDTECSGP